MTNRCTENQSRSTILLQKRWHEKRIYFPVFSVPWEKSTIASWTKHLILAIDSNCDDNLATASSSKMRSRKCLVIVISNGNNIDVQTMQVLLKFRILAGVFLLKHEKNLCSGNVSWTSVWITFRGYESLIRSQQFWKRREIDSLGQIRYFAY